MANSILDAIEEIRVEKRLPVARMCEGIFSERTYRRYLRLQTSMNISDLFKLTSRLKIKVVDLMFYLLKDKNMSLQFKEFLIDFYVDSYEADLETYHKIRNYENPIPEIDLLVKALVKKFEYKRRLITKHRYQEFLVDNIQKVVDKQFRNVYDLTFLVIFLEEFPKNRYFSVDQLVDDFSDSFIYKQRAIMYLLATDKLMRIIEDLPTTNLEKYEKIIDMFSVAAYAIGDKNFIDDANFHKAWLYFRLNRKAEFEHYLFRYLSGRNLVSGNREFDLNKKRILDKFDINIVDFQESCLKKIIK